MITKDTIILIFTEALDSASAMNPTSYSFDNGLGQPTYIYPIALDFKKIKLKISSSLVAGIRYNVSVLWGIKDCIGNSVNTLVSAPFALPQAPVVNDVIINEILFDPNTGGVDFIEPILNKILLISSKFKLPIIASSIISILFVTLFILN